MRKRFFTILNSEIYTTTANTPRKKHFESSNSFFPLTKANENLSSPFLSRNAIKENYICFMFRLRLREILLNLSQLDSPPLRCHRFIVGHQCFQERLISHCITFHHGAYVITFVLMGKKRGIKIYGAIRGNEKLLLIAKRIASKSFYGNYQHHSSTSSDYENYINLISS